MKLKTRYICNENQKACYEYKTLPLIIFYVEPSFAKLVTKHQLDDLGASGRKKPTGFA